MITFKQFLEEKESQSITELIKKNCEPFLRQVEFSGFLVRGVKGLANAESHIAIDSEGEEMEYAIKSVRQDRKPMDITAQRTRLIDDWFEKKFGFRARSQTMFTYGQNMHDQVAFYGRPCVVFPIGPMKYVWSPRVTDMFGALDIYTGYEGDTRASHELTDEELGERLHKWLESKNYKDTGLPEAVHSTHEVMVKCDSYYAFPIGYMPQLKKSLGFA